MNALVGPEKEDSRGQNMGHATAEVALTFGVGLSTVERYVATAPEGIRHPEKASRLETETGRSGEEAAGSGTPRAAGCHAHPEARVSGTDGAGFGERVHDQQDAQEAGVDPKKFGGCDRTRRVPEGRLENFGRRQDRRGAPRFRGREGLEHLAASAVRLVEAGRGGARERPTQLGQERHPALQHDDPGYATVHGGEGGHDEDGLQGLRGGGAVPLILCGARGSDEQPLRPQGRENVGADRGRGCRLLYLPSYSPAFD